MVDLPLDDDIEVVAGPQDGFLRFLVSEGEGVLATDAHDSVPGLQPRHRRHGASVHLKHTGTCQRGLTNVHRSDLKGIK